MAAAPTPAAPAPQAAGRPGLIPGRETRGAGTQGAARGSQQHFDGYISEVKGFSFLCLAIEPIDFSVQVFSNQGWSWRAQQLGTGASRQASSTLYRHASPVSNYISFLIYLLHAQIIAH